jgi:ornithine carbamoyltransferase
MHRDYLRTTDLSTQEFHEIFELTAKLKLDRKQGKQHVHLLAGKTLALIFQKPSLRTRVSFETAMFELGGHAIHLAPTDIGFGKREAVQDIGRVLSRYNHLIMARVFGHFDIVQLAEEATIPVLNGISDYSHPCQVLADIYTIWELRNRDLDGLKVVYAGEGKNNVAHSWLDLSQRIPMDLTIACPRGYEPDAGIFSQARESGVSKVSLTHDLLGAVPGAHAVYTDVWASMGQEDQLERRKVDFRDFQVNREVMDAAGPSAIFMHDLPANRGLEATDEVMDGPQSVIYEEAENRLHTQKALMIFLLREA